MHNRSYAVALTALSLAACSTDAVAPVAATAVPNARVSSIAELSTNYIVLTKGNGIPTGFAQTVSRLGGAVTYSNAKAGFVTVSGLSASAASQIKAIAGVADVEADAPVSLDAPLAAAQADGSQIQNPSIASQSDPTTASRFSWQWNMRLIGADAAWAAGKLGNSGVTVAILDTGIDYDAPDLNGLVDLSRSTSFMNTFVKATDTSTVRPADDTVSKHFFSTRNVISDYNGHGTNVATQVSSKAAALAGVTSKTTLIGVKVLGSNGVGSFGQILSGILWAADHGADVANMSLGGDFAKAGNGRLVGIINATFNYAKQHGMLIVVAAGNSSADLQHNGNQEATFCDSPHVECVTSVGLPTWTGNPDTPAFYTNFGRSAVGVAAPGGNADFNADGSIKVSTGWPWAPAGDIASWVWSFCSKTLIGGWTAANVPRLTVCANGNRLTGFIGTSQASPHVAGLAALLVDKYGHGQPQTIKHAIEQSADPINPLLGRGRISVKNALGL
jgi:lantibiotic leader peptide-processing serine protease